MLLCAASLLLTPPNLRTEPAQGQQGRITPISSADQLTIRLGELTESDETLGLAVKNLDTNQTYALNADATFDAASTSKVLIAAYFYNQASANRFDLDELVTIPDGDVQRYGTGSIQYESSPYRYTYRELVKRMLAQSDNTAAYVLAGKLGTDQLQTYANELGLQQTRLDGPNTTTPHDMLTVLEKLYRNQLADPELTKELLGYMQDTQFEDRLPAKLPNDATVYHKTGDALSGGFDDVGIVSYQGTTYAIALYTKGMPKERLADISQAVFAFQAK